ncbi:cytochrome P450 736A117-like [Spinacia oleracea]|uniref:Cytochrome P450 736A117-like n=1 Tax=Spinacia oleracea TaxID=3562 RepID=A0A9R0JAA8_SPIOL|nr:cytochrome P450 736A117-like [Spinacia oleracea]
MSSALQFLKNFGFHPLSLPFILFLIFLYKWLNKKPAKTRKLPPSPRKLPILGNLHQLGQFLNRSLYSLSKQYGEVMLIYIGNTPSIVISSASAAREVMKTHDVIFSNRPRSRIVNKIIYDGKDLAFSPYGEFWRQIRSICVLQLLSTKKVQSFRKVREEEVDLVVQMIKRSEHCPVNLSETFVMFSTNILCRTAFGKKYVGEVGTNFKQLLKDYVEVIGKFSMGDIIPWLGWIDRLSGLERRVDKVAREFDDFLQHVVQEHLDRKTEKEENDKDFVDILLDAQKENPAALQMDSIKAIVLDMFVAGSDTTYTVLEWAMTELLRHPQVMKQLQDEVRGVVREKTIVSEDDLETMKYLKAVIKEVLRLHPPLPLLLFRQTSQNVKINGYDIAARTHVIINAWAIQRDPVYWENPEEFRPERFLNCSVDFKGQDFQLIPFGAGRRGCPGITFFSVNAELVLANLVHLFDWKSANEAEDETSDVPENPGIVINRRDPLLVIATLHS